MCVINVRDCTPFDVYIARANPRYRLAASKWANPFKIGRDGTRAEVIAMYGRLRAQSTRPHRRTARITWQGSRRAPDPFGAAIER
jgi:Domain of unknown function (DUF4326)